MKCLASLRYKIKKSKFLKLLKKFLEDPDKYLDIYEQFLSIFIDFKQPRYEPNELSIKFDSLLESKGLKSKDKVKKELDIRNKIIEDNNILNKIIKDIKDIDSNVNELQELVIKVLQDNKALKEKYKTLNLLNFKKTMKNRSTISSK